MSRYLLLALPLALAACMGQTAAVLVDHELPDAQAESAPELGTDAAPDVGRDAGAPDVASADVWTDASAEATVDAGVDALDGGAADVGAEDAPADASTSTYCDDAGHCFEPDGSWCENPAFYGCAPDPNGNSSCWAISWQENAYTCATPPPGCSRTPTGVICCASICQ